MELGPPDRPARLLAPPSVSGRAPLLILLHGYGSSSEEVDRYFGAAAQAASRGMYLILPDGMKEDSGKQFWDATAACCNFTGTPVDDVGYIRALIEQALSERPIDPGRVYVMGHSNGGFMSYRIACELPDVVTAVAVVSGAEPATAPVCATSPPVSVLHVHGHADPLILYDGGTLEGTPYAGAVESVRRWAARYGCAHSPVVGAPVDLVSGPDRAETVVTAHSGCAEGVDVQLDTIEGGDHVPDFSPDGVGRYMLDWLLDHTR